jgi:hypothetical protein
LKTSLNSAKKEPGKKNFQQGGRPSNIFKKEQPMEVRKFVMIVEEVCQEAGKRVSPPHRKVASIAVVKNPLAGRYAEKLDELIEIGARMGTELTERAIQALGVKPEQIHSFGKAAIVGTEGELEHAAAILHPQLGQTMRQVLKAGKAIIPSAKKVAVAGSTIDVPLHYKDEMRVRSHYDAMEVRVGGAPRPDEILICVAFTDSGRPLARVPGLTLEEFLQKG